MAASVHFYTEYNILYTVHTCLQLNSPYTYLSKNANLQGIPCYAARACSLNALRHLATSYITLQHRSFKHLIVQPAAPLTLGHPSSTRPSSCPPQSSPKSAPLPLYPSTCPSLCPSTYPLSPAIRPYQDSTRYPAALHYSILHRHLGSD